MGLTRNDQKVKQSVSVQDIGERDGGYPSATLAHHLHNGHNEKDDLEHERREPDAPNKGSYETEAAVNNGVGMECCCEGRSGIGVMVSQQKLTT